VAKVIVSGGSGFVGLALVRRLSGMGHEVVALARHDSPAVRRAGARMVVGDICDLPFIIQASKGADTFFHVAAKAGVWGSWDEYQRINVTGSANVIEACRQNAIPRLVYTSTPSVVFSGASIRGAGEELPYGRRFLCHYARSKAMAEAEVLRANGPGLRTVALRPHLIWGPGDTNLIPRIVERGRAGLLRQVGDGTNRVDISYIDNVVEAHILAEKDLACAGRGAGRAYFISQGEPVNLWDWINTLFDGLCLERVARRVSFRKAYLGGAFMELIYLLARRKEEPLMTRFVAEQLAKDHWFSIAAARRDLGYVPQVSTAAGMERLLAWLKRGGEDGDS